MRSIVPANARKTAPTKAPAKPTPDNRLRNENYKALFVSATNHTFFERNTKGNRATNSDTEDAFQGLWELISEFDHEGNKQPNDKNDETHKNEEKEDTKRNKTLTIEIKWCEKKRGGCMHPATEVAMAVQRALKEHNSRWPIPGVKSIVSIGDTRWFSFGEKGVQYIGESKIPKGTIIGVVKGEIIDQATLPWTPFWNAEQLLAIAKRYKKTPRHRLFQVRAETGTLFVICAERPPAVLKEPHLDGKFPMGMGVQFIGNVPHTDQKVQCRTARKRVYCYQKGDCKGRSIVDGSQSDRRPRWEHGL